MNPSKKYANLGEQFFDYSSTNELHVLFIKTVISDEMIARVQGTPLEDLLRTLKPYEAIVFEKRMKPNTKIMGLNKKEGLRDELTLTNELHQLLFYYLTNLESETPYLFTTNISVNGKSLGFNSEIINVKNMTERELKLFKALQDEDFNDEIILPINNEQYELKIKDIVQDLHPMTVSEAKVVLTFDKVYEPFLSFCQLAKYGDKNDSQKMNELSEIEASWAALNQQIKKAENIEKPETHKQKDVVMTDDLDVLPVDNFTAPPILLNEEVKVNSPKQETQKEQAAVNIAAIAPIIETIKVPVVETLETKESDEVLHNDEYETEAIRSSEKSINEEQTQNSIPIKGDETLHNLKVVNENNEPLQFFNGDTLDLTGEIKLHITDEHELKKG